MSDNPNFPLTSSTGRDITEAVQILYDIAHSSMDWGSGMLDFDEMVAVIEFAHAMGFALPDLPSNSSQSPAIVHRFPNLYEAEMRTQRMHSEECSLATVYRVKYDTHKDRDCCEGRMVEYPASYRVKE